MAKTNEPETLAQVRTHEAFVRRYKRAGLCTRCAAQSGYGHQLGFRNLEHKPCTACAPIVNLFPVARPNGWRTLEPERPSGWTKLASDDREFTA